MASHPSFLAIMPPIPAGALIMFSVATLVALLANFRLKGFFLATAASVAISPLAFLIVCIAQAGLPDHIALFDYLVLAVMSLPSAVVVGLSFKVARSFRANKKPATPTQAP